MLFTIFLQIFICHVDIEHAFWGENLGIFEIKFDPSNFSPWIGDVDLAESQEVSDSADEAYAERVAKRNDFGINCKKEKPPSFNYAKPMQHLVGGFLGHRMELKCPHRRGCPRYDGMT